MSMMTKVELVEAAYEMTGGSVEDLSLEKLRFLMTVTQYVTDLCLNEIEDRGARTYTRDSDRVIIPYQCDHMVQTVLTRGNGPYQPGRLAECDGAYRKHIGVGQFEDVLNVAREAVEAENPEAAADELERLFLALAGF